MAWLLIGAAAMTNAEFNRKCIARGVWNGFAYVQPEADGYAFPVSVKAIAAWLADEIDAINESETLAYLASEHLN
jgi:hypothetical protein